MNQIPKSSADASTTPTIESIATSIRRIRTTKGLTLKDVEVQSRGKWKAVVIGSYERCDRALSLNKAVKLAQFYEVPLEELLGIASKSHEATARFTFDMRRISSLASEELTSFQRFLNSLAATRRDWNGEVLTIRTADAPAVAALLGLKEDQLIEKLKYANLLLLNY